MPRWPPASNTCHLYTWSVMARKQQLCSQWIVNEHVIRLGCFSRRRYLLAVTTSFSYLLALNKIVLQTVFILVIRLSNSVPQILVLLGNCKVVPEYFRGNRCWWQKKICSYTFACYNSFSLISSLLRVRISKYKFKGVSLKKNIQHKKCEFKFYSDYL